MNKKLLGVALVGGLTAGWLLRKQIQSGVAWLEEKYEEAFGRLVALGLPHVSLSDPTDPNPNLDNMEAIDKFLADPSTGVSAGRPRTWADSE